MKLTMRDISKKQETKTLILINKKSIENIELFSKVIDKYNKFHKLESSSINLKFYTNFDLGISEKLYLKVRKEYLERI
jgi:hypothetical protein